jgi:hypothetical protein
MHTDRALDSAPDVEQGVRLTSSDLADSKLDPADAAVGSAAHAPVSTAITTTTTTAIVRSDAVGVMAVGDAPVTVSNNELAVIANISSIDKPRASKLSVAAASRTLSKHVTTVVSAGKEHADKAEVLWEGIGAGKKLKVTIQMTFTTQCTVHNSSAYYDDQHVLCF